MGRKKKPINLVVLEGNPGKRKIPETPQPPSEMPTPPKHIDVYGLEEWNRIAHGLNVMGVLSQVDQSALAAYCMAYSRWRRAEEEIAVLAADPKSKGALVIKTVSGNYIQNPLIGIANKAAADMVRYAAEFGMTPSARARLGVGSEKPKSKFEGLVGMKGGKK
jgi:P27 family predicted phage terminase small subunit